MAGDKTHAQQIRTIEHKEGPNVPADRDTEAGPGPAAHTGSHQENRDHHKHNKSGQEGHKPQKHSPAEEKH